MTFVNKGRDEKQIRLSRLKACQMFYRRANSFSKFMCGLDDRAKHKLPLLDNSCKT